MTEWMLQDAARAHDLRYVALRYFNVAGADPRGRSASRRRNATHLIKVAGETALGKPAVHRGLRHRLPDPRRHLRARLHPGQRPRRRASRGARPSAPRRRQPDPELRLRPRLLGAGGHRRGEAGLGRRLSRSASRPRRPGDPAQIVAKADRIREELGWRPRHDDLDGIVHQALAWERALKTRNQR